MSLILLGSILLCFDLAFLIIILQLSYLPKTHEVAKWNGVQYGIAAQPELQTQNHEIAINVHDCIFDTLCMWIDILNLVMFLIMLGKLGPERGCRHGKIGK